MTDMTTEPAHVQVEYLIDCIARGLDELIALSHDPKFSDAVEQNEMGAGQVLTRAQLLVSFLMARKPPKLKRIGHV